MRIDNDVLEVLSRATISWNDVTLPEQLDKKLYARVAKVLEAAGAKWNRSARCHVFAPRKDGDSNHASDALEQAILVGEITTRQDIDFFETPDPIIDLMLEAADLRPTHQVLEPSAGRGAIAKRIQAVGARRLVCIEKDPENVRHLRLALGTDRGIMEPRDFMEMTPAGIGDFDRVVMNPPFSKQQDIAHIRHAFEFLKPGGRIVSIASPGLMYRQDRKAQAFREWLDAHDHDIHRLPDGSFKSSGTAVTTIMISIDRS